MITVIKIAVLVVLFFLFSYPLLPFSSKLKRFSTFYTLKYDAPFQKRNFVFIPLTFVGFAAVVLLFEALTGLGNKISTLPFMPLIAAGVQGLIGDRGNFFFLTLQVLLINMVILYAFVFVKGLLRHLILDPILGWGKKGKLSPEERRARREAVRRRREEKKMLRRRKRDAKKRKKTVAPPPPETTPAEEDDDGENDHVMRFPHPEEEESKKSETPTVATEVKRPAPPRTAFMRGLLGIFFQGPDYIYARPSVARAASVLQCFVYIVEGLYFLLFLAMAAAALFPMPDIVYALGVKLSGVYLYPFISLIFLQEICNFLHTDMPEPEAPPKLVADQVGGMDEKQCEAKLLALTGEFQKRFDAEHCFRYYPALPGEQLPDFPCNNRPYAGALAYIRAYERQTAGHVVQSYMECLNAAYNGNHIYFGTSFYSEFGEYLTAYAYTRLLSGARMIFITSRSENVEPLRKYVRDRLTHLTNSRDAATWRVYVGGERLDQADVLIATPEDFRDDSMIRHYPGFFEEVCNAVFIDAERVTSIYGYLCPVISLRLQKATGDRIRFLFLTKDVLRGFAAKTLLRYFCIEKVYTCSNALENESTSYMLINRESKSRRVYNHHRQSLTGLECIMAQQALLFGIDGVKIITGAPIDHADKEYLESQAVEINTFYKSIPAVNYLIYSDENCNLASAIYTCTRFRGQQKSVANIISKPYLLRDYFVFMAGQGDYINRSSFIQPRAVENIDVGKLTLLRIFCEASMDDGMPLSEFCRRMRSAIEAGGGHPPAFCQKMAAAIRAGELTPTEAELAEYLVAGLLDDQDTKWQQSAGRRAKDYYLIIDPRYNVSAVARDKWICFKRSRDFLAQLTARSVRVELRLNGQTVGYLDTFPNRVPQQYMVGQSLIYQNVEYEIDRISDDYTVIFLRSENVTFRNSLDTIFLRRYAVKGLHLVGDEGILYNSNANLAEIRVSHAEAHILGQSYGFLTLTCDNQTLDFPHGVEGNPWVGDAQIEKNTRDIRGDACLAVTLRSRIPCNDGMRLLIAVVFNEFIKTLFPTAYRMLAVCPVLEAPVEKTWGACSTVTEQIRSLYPYLTAYLRSDKTAEDGSAADCLRETDDHRIQLLLINDCHDDVGILDWFYDGKAHYIREILSHIYSYLQWLKHCGRPGCYIYFGEQKLPECFDLEGCCRLMDGLGMILSDDGKEDFDTAAGFAEKVKRRRCAFCHKVVDSGRYALFDRHRYICMECFDVVHEEAQLAELQKTVATYLRRHYPEIALGKLTVAFDGVHDLKADQAFTEFSCRVAYDTRTVYVERDIPKLNAELVLLRAMIAMWQHDNELLIPAAEGQLRYEELRYLRLRGHMESADWIYGAIPSWERSVVDDITTYIKCHTDGETAEEREEKEKGEEAEETTPAVPIEFIKEEPREEEPEEPKEDEEAPAQRYTSFRYLLEKMQESEEEDSTPPEEEEDEGVTYSDKLYDPNKIPRFWKDYLRGKKATEQEDDLSDDDRDLLDDDELEELGRGDGDIVPVEGMNAPPEDGTTEEEGDVTGKSDIPAEKEPATAEEETEKPPRRGLFGFFKRKKDKDKKEETAEEAAPSADEEPQAPADEEADEEKRESKEDKKKARKERKKKKGEKGTKEGKESPAPEKEVPPAEEDPADTSKEEPGEEETREGEEPPAEPEGKKPRKQPRKVRLGKKFYDNEEKTNPRIRLYNEMLRHIYGFDDTPISTDGISKSEVERIFYYVLYDWPEIFWVQGYATTVSTVRMAFRCLRDDGKVDRRQVAEKLKAIKRGAREFTRGISRRTKPYEACLKIYRRLIMTLDYDSIGLGNGAGNDIHLDDRLRSLYGALVDHRVVCAGYAVAMQYLLQSVGICCGVVSSERSGGSGHAFNALRLGKYCYYMDATWGDSSNTMSGDADHDQILYNYFCVPYRELVQVSPAQRHYHMPNRQLYPQLEEFKATRHEYFRHHEAFFDRYDEEKLIALFIRQAEEYDPREMGAFSISMRFVDVATRDYVAAKLASTMWDLLAKARQKAAKKKKVCERLTWNRYRIMQAPDVATLYYFPQ